MRLTEPLQALTENYFNKMKEKKMPHYRSIRDEIYTERQIFNAIRLITYSKNMIIKSSMLPKC